MLAQARGPVEDVVPLSHVDWGPPAALAALPAALTALPVALAAPIYDVRIL